MKLKLSLLFVLGGFLASFAQTADIEQSNTHVIKTEKPSRSFKEYEKYDMTKFNRPKSAESFFERNGISAATRNSQGRPTDLEVEPFAQIDINRWGIIENFDTQGEVLFSTKRLGNTFSVKTYNDDIEIVESFSIEVPASANQVEVMNHYSTGFFSNDGAAEFMIFVHYFDENIPGPEGQIWEVWVVNEDGEILNELSAFSAKAHMDSAGNHKLITYFDDEENVTIKSYDAVSGELFDSYSFGSELTLFLNGSPFDFITVDEEEYIVLAHYRTLFMDNMTLEVFPDNNLMVKLLNFDLDEVKSMSLDIETRYPDAGEFVIPMAQYGIFYRDQTYDISSDIFNPDSKLEVVYGISYYDMIGDNEWSTYLVANEDGEVLHELNEYIIDTFPEMNSIEGQDNQLGFLMGEGGIPTTIAFFNIESWTIDHSFEAITNGDQISSDFNRIPSGDSFHYLIGIGEPDEDNGNVYGVVGEYDRDGSTVHRHRFLLPEDVVLFQPILTQYALIPNLFMPNEEIYFMYVYKQMQASGSIFNNLAISKSGESPLVEFRGDTSMGNIIGSTFLTDGNGTFNKMTIQYETADNQMITDFYRLPFDDELGVESSENIQFVLYPNPTNGVLNIQSKTATRAIQVYGITGNLLLNQPLGATNQSVDLSFLANGIYIAKITLDNGTSQQVKFIKN